MSVFIFIVHPARVHLYKNVIKKLEDDGINTRVFIRDKESVCELLDAYDIPYEILSEQSSSLSGLIVEQAKLELQSLARAISEQPELMIGGFGTPIIAKGVGSKAIDFFDTDHVSRMNNFQVTFLDSVYTPDSYTLDHGKKQCSYPGYHELAYLHPNRFVPDRSVLNKVGLSDSDRFVILRAVAWNALHDVGGSRIDNLQDVVSRLEAQGVDVLVSSETELPKPIRKYKIEIEPHLIHHLMSYAELFIGDSATMATESAVLGTPTVYMSSIRTGNLDELEERYGLVYNFTDQDKREKGIKKAISILRNGNQSKYQDRRENMLEDKIDVSKYMYDEVCKYLHE